MRDHVRQVVKLGELRIDDRWAAVRVSSSDVTAIAMPCYFEGDAVRGGDFFRAG